MKEIIETSLIVQHIHDQEYSMYGTKIINNFPFRISFAHLPTHPETNFTHAFSIEPNSQIHIPETVDLKNFMIQLT